MAGEDYAGIGKETTFDLFATSTEWINYISETFSAEHQTDLSPGAFFSSPRNEGRGRTLINGGIRAKLTVDNIGHFLRAMLGIPVTTVLAGADAGAFEHRFTPNKGLGRLAPSASVLVSRAFELGEWQYTGFSPSRIGFEGTLDQDIRYTAEGPVNDELVVDPPAGVPAITTLAPFNHHDSTWQLGSTPTEQITVEGWSIDIAADTELVGSIGRFKGRRVHRSAFAITGRVDEDFDTLARYKQFLGNDTALSPQKVLTAQNVLIKIDNGVPAVGGGTVNSALEFKLPKVKFFSSEVNQEERNRTTQGTQWQALFDDVTLNFEAEIMLRNTAALAVYS